MNGKLSISAAAVTALFLAAAAANAEPPNEPRVVDFGSLDKSIGKPGGQIRMLMGKGKDIRMMTVYGGARLASYNQDFELVPDILLDIEVEDSRVFTLKLRPGHKWSDGHPFTAEDFRYAWEDVITDETLGSKSANRFLAVEGELPKFEVIDDKTVRYSWSKPNPLFLPAISGALPVYIYRPAHYMKQFHAKYQDAAKLEEMVKSTKARDWIAMHTVKGRQYRAENPDLPTLQPWQNTTAPPSERFVFKRNPHYHRVDPDGTQLPYIDEVVINVASSSVIPAKVGAGESDLQARYLRFDNYTFLKESAQRHDFTVHLWPNGKGSHIAIMPNLNVNDPVWRPIIRDPRFRRALSVAMDRSEINHTLYYGLVLEMGNSVLPGSPLYREENALAWAEYDPALANKLLDEVGLDKKDSEGFRLLPNGKRAEVIIETAGESTEETDVLQLVKEQWAKVGIEMFIRSSQRDILRRRVASGDTMMSVFSGLDRGLATPEMNPEELAPVSPYQLNWPKWGQHYESAGTSGEPIDVPEVQRLADLYQDWLKATSIGDRSKIWSEMLNIYTDQVFTIGIISGALQPVVVSNRLNNVPEEGIYAFEPTKFFGHYYPDTFWLEQ